MIKKNRGVFLFILIMLVIGLGLYAIWMPDSSLIEVTETIRQSTPESPLPSPSQKIVMKEGRKVLGIAPKEEDEIKDLKVTNKVSPKWEENLKLAVTRQGGNTLKSINVIKEDSFIWVHGGVGLNVESVLVNLQGQRDQETSFRALVDSQTGKILQTWDWPIVDEFIKSEDSGVALDPRYQGQ